MENKTISLEEAKAMMLYKTMGLRAAGCIPSDYDPLVYSLKEVAGAAEAPKTYPETYRLNFDAPPNEQYWYSNCVAQVIERAFEFHFGIKFGVSMVYGGARERDHLGLDPLTALKFACENGIAPLKDDPDQMEVPKVSKYYQANKERLLAAAAPYAKKLQFVRLYNTNEIKTAMMNGGFIAFRMEVSRNGLNNYFWFRGDGKNGVGHHFISDQGWGVFPVSTRRSDPGAYVMNSWGEDWGVKGACYMDHLDLFRHEVYSIFKVEETAPVRRSLCKGMTGADVLEAQQLLQKHGYLKDVEIKGNFGSETFNAVVQFQDAKNISDPDGIIGPATWPELLKDPTPITPGTEPATTRDKILDKVFKAGSMLIGSNYSQSNRYKIYPGGSFDCSTFVQGIFNAAGVMLKSGTNELTYAAEQIMAQNFDTIYLNDGKKAPVGHVASVCKPGDIVFFSFQRNGRKYNISHVAVVDRSGKEYIQTANNDRKCERIPFNFQKYDENVICILRLKMDYTPVTPAPLKKGSRDMASVRMLQTILNTSRGERLVCDGDYGALTAKAVKEVNDENKISGDACTAETWKALGL